MKSSKRPSPRRGFVKRAFNRAMSILLVSDADLRGVLYQSQRYLNDLRRQRPTYRDDPVHHATPLHVSYSGLKPYRSVGSFLTLVVGLLCVIGNVFFFS